MKQLVSKAWAALVVTGLATAACGGGPKPPMVPDSPDPALVTSGGDGGSDMPAPAPVPSPTVKK